MCQLFEPARPDLRPASAAWPDDPHGRYAGALSRQGRDLAVAVSLEVRPDGIAATLDVPALGVVAAPFAVAAYEPPTLVLGMPGDDGGMSAWSGVVDGDRIAGQWHGGTIDARFEVTRCPIEAAPFTVQEVACQGAAGRLAGSLIRPLGIGPHPAALHVPGPGGGTREDARFLAQLLARHGVASLILDAPGTGRSTGAGAAAGLDGQARDAVAGVRLLRGAEGIDPRRVGLVAGGAAGWTAPVAACLIGDLAFLVLRSAPMMSPAARQRLAADTPPAPVDPAAGGGRQWARRDMEFDPVPMLAALDLPVLAIYGERDRWIPALDCAAALVRLRRRQGRDVTVHVFAGTDHDLVQRPAPAEPFDWPRLPAGYLPALVAWMQTRVLRPH